MAALSTLQGSLQRKRLQTHGLDLEPGLGTYDREERGFGVAGFVELRPQMPQVSVQSAVSWRGSSDMPSEEIRSSSERESECVRELLGTILHHGTGSSGMPSEKCGSYNVRERGLREKKHSYIHTFRESVVYWYSSPGRTS